MASTALCGGQVNSGGMQHGREEQEQLANTRCCGATSLFSYEVMIWFLYLTFPFITQHDSPSPAPNGSFLVALVCKQLCTLHPLLLSLTLPTHSSACHHTSPPTHTYWHTISHVHTHTHTHTHTLQVYNTGDVTMCRGSVTVWACWKG